MCHDTYPHPQKPKKLSRGVFIMAGKIIDREKYGGLRPKPPLFPRSQDSKLFNDPVNIIFIKTR